MAFSSRIHSMFKIWQPSHCLMCLRSQNYRSSVKWIYAGSRPRLLQNQRHFMTASNTAVQSKLRESPKSNKKEEENIIAAESPPSSESEAKDNPKPSSQRAKLAKVFAAYGTTGVVFHTTISLTSLGISYMAVSSGVDVVGLLQKVGLITELTTEAKLATGASTFVIAYACHKVFMPVRIFLTVTCTPLIVNKLKQLGFLQTQGSKT